MTVRALGELIIWAGAVCGALYAIWGLLRMAVVNPIRKSIGAELSPVSDKLKAVEQKVGNLDQRMSDHIATHSKLGLPYCRATVMVGITPGTVSENDFTNARQ